MSVEKAATSEPNSLKQSASTTINDKFDVSIDDSSETGSHNLNSDREIEISRNAQITNTDCTDVGNCDPLPRLDLTDLIESNDDKLFERKEKIQDEIVGSFQSKLSIQSNEFCEINTSSDWDLKTFLSESALQRNDIDVLIMSEAGKPIYCYSGREDVTTLVGVVVALINYVIKTQNDQLKTIRTRTGLNIHFAMRSPLVIVAVCRRLTCFDEQILINQIHSQIISTVTLKKLKSIFEQAPTYDLKRIIHKNDFKTLDILVKTITTPITDLFPTYKNKRNNGKYHSGHRIFNNVISFYTSTVSIPRSTTSSLSSLNNSSMIFLHDHKPNVLSRVYVPIAIMNSNVREQVTSIINQSVSINSDIVFSILFHIEDEETDIDGSIDSHPFVNETMFPTSEFITNNMEWNHFTNNLISSSDTDDQDGSSCNDLYESFESSNVEPDHSPNERPSRHPPSRSASTSMDENQNLKPSTPIQNKNLKELKLISVCNHTTKFRINPLDIQLLYALIKASDSLLTSTESLWIPLCLSRVDANRFLHAHVSYLSKKYCLILLDVDHNNFEKCRQIKETINFKLDQIRLSEPMIGLCSNISELGQPHLQYLCHQTPRHCIVWQSSIQTEFSPLNYYLIDRMQRSSFKTLWLRSMKEQCALLGWQTATFQLYAQFDGFVTKQSALETVTTFLKWFKKEEDKLIVKDN